MSVHDEIQQAMRQVISQNQHIVLLSPTFVALQVFDVFGGSEEPHVRWLSLEQAKQLARKILAAKFEPDGEENETYQNDMFSGLLQDRYPIPRTPGTDPVYKPRESLTNNELDWNIDQLTKSADARVKHAAALRSYRDQRVAQAA